MNFIWKNGDINLAELNALGSGTLAQLIDIQFIEIGENYLLARMPVTPKTHQPFGLLHGGASAVLAETVGSVASWLCIDASEQMCVGIEINCNHVRGKRDGVVTARVEPLHIGATTHVWDIKITDERQKLICVSRLTVAVVKKQ